MSDGRKYDVGDVVGDLEVVGVSYNEDGDGNKINFTYQFKDAKEVQEEREVAAQIAEELKNQNEE